MTARLFVSRLEQFATVASTNDVVAAWLADGVDEICLAWADEQTAGRGRHGRSWVPPPGAALLLSLGFRPDWLPADRHGGSRRPYRSRWPMPRGGAGIPNRTVRLKWPNDLVVVDPPDRGGAVRKLGGVLGEATGIGDDDPRVVVGIGVNVDWPAAAFPPDLAASMTSLLVESGGRPTDRDAVLDAFLARLEPRIEALRDGRFAVARLGCPPGVPPHAGAPRPRHSTRATPRMRLAIGVDPITGALVVEDANIARRREGWSTPARRLTFGSGRNAMAGPVFGR